MISTVPHHTDEQIPTGRKNRQGEEVLKPRAIIDYNQDKKGVDISDQMSSYYTCLRKSVKWYKKVIFEIILGTCVVNAWVIHSSHNQAKNKLDMLRFREKLIDGLLSDTEENGDSIEAAGEIRVVHDVPGNTSSRKRARSSHRLGKYEGNARKSRKRCSNCYKMLKDEKGRKVASAQASKVLTFCEDCNGQPTLFRVSRKSTNRLSNLYQ
ncbi:unnamed protein product [Acanthoscelides obtectus]|uniref:PiggyBac transposable element-derived protein domain-containing protein n=1 Tax=Acanthoscelides obtectus TaxID=200917 RepID=A0A9P0LEB2_ACAOB|nr:unnamed protein product [Acanthoscelides obtectus]CAK1680641.1 PiggyBac transposable element-derived protein 4 [Acanthoscelides obtectus]